MKGFKNKKGISLIVLVITIIVMIILAAAIILSLSNSGIIGKSNEAKFKSDVKTMQEELAVLNANNTLQGNNTAITINDLTSAQDYKDKFIVQEGKLKYVKAKLTAEEITWAEEVDLKSNVTKLANGENGVTINESGSLTIDCTKFALTHVEIPNSVTYISDEAFSGCTSLVSVEIPNSVTSIGDMAFSDTSLVSIIIPNSINSIGPYTFSSCSSLTSITLPNSVRVIAPYAFSGCTSLASIEIPNGVTSIESYTFYDCTSLKNITIEGIERFDADDVKSWFNVTDISDITITGTGYAG